MAEELSFDIELSETVEEQPRDEPPPEPAAEAAPEPAQAEADSEPAESSEPPPEPPPEEPQPSRAQQRIQQEINKRKELEAKLAEFERKQAELEARLQPQQPTEEIPSFDEDPAANLNARLEQVNKQLSAQTEQQKAQFEQQQQRDAVTNYLNKLNTQGLEFAKERPDYTEAVNWLYEKRAAELRTMGVPEEQVHPAMLYETAQRAYHMEQMRADGDPIMGFYEMAKNLGWSPAKPPPPQTDLEKLKENVEAAESLGPSGRGEQRITMETLNQMDEDEFGEYVDDKNWEKLVRSLGGR